MEHTVDLAGQSALTFKVNLPKPGNVTFFHTSTTNEVASCQPRPRIFWRISTRRPRRRATTTWWGRTRPGRIGTVVSRLCWSFILAIVVVLGVFAPNRAWAQSPSEAENRVEGIDLVVPVVVGLGASSSADLHRGIGGFTCERAVGATLAAEGIAAGAPAAESALSRAATSAPEQFFIENGVRRSLAVRQAGMTEIPATVYRPGQAPMNTTVRLDQLFSPKTSVPMDSRFMRIQPPIHTPIEVQPLGLPGQQPSIPIWQVILGP